jgi:DNA-binding transcriptional LysR family regulator
MESWVEEKPNEWARLDLNLLLPLNALLMESNVTKAAQRLAVGQPTMSVALAKLRRHFDDPLLVRNGRDLVLTPFGESLREPVQDALLAARKVLTAARTFDAETTDRTFLVIASDYVTRILLHPLMSELAKAAPQVRLTIESLRSDVVDSLRSRRCDLAFWPLSIAPQELLNFPSQQIITDEFIVVADNSRPPDPEPLSPEDLAANPAVLVAGQISNAPMPDLRLGNHGLRQTAAITVDSFGLALQTVAGTNLVTVTQRRLFEQMGAGLGLREVPTTAQLPILSLAMFWHPRHVQWPAHQFLREHLIRIATKL